MSKTNAKEEFLQHTAGKQVKCANLLYGDEYGLHGDERRKYILKADYNKIDFENFLSYLDFCYDSGYGGQELFGTIWYTNGTWSERGEYDGAEWWVHREVPEIPEELK